MVTREQMSGANSTVGSRVDRKIANDGDKSMSYYKEGANYDELTIKQNILTFKK